MRRDWRAGINEKDKRKIKANDPKMFDELSRIFFEDKDLKVLVEIIVNLHAHSNDMEKVTIWLNTKNPMFGGLIPMSLFCAGRGQKVLRIINDAKEGNIE